MFKSIYVSTLGHLIGQKNANLFCWINYLIIIFIALNIFQRNFKQICSSMVLIAAKDFFSKIVPALKVDENLKFTLLALSL